MDINKIDMRCPQCRVHTMQREELIANGRFIRSCNECGCSVVYEANGNIITDEQLKKEREEWL